MIFAAEKNFSRERNIFIAKTTKTHWFTHWFTHKLERYDMTTNNRLGKGTGLRPHVWKSGTDPLRHEQYTQWLRQRAQANFRREGWDMPFEDFVEIWGTDWVHRGRASEQLCMTRTNYDQPWSTHNVVIVPRHEHVRRSWVVKFARGQTGPKHKRKPQV